jgi:uncharacterized protein YjbJ (UPF0337 family)
MGKDKDPEESKKRRQAKNSIAEETSAVGQRIRGKIKEAAGALIADKKLEKHGKRVAKAGKKRQRKNDAV